MTVLKPSQLRIKAVFGKRDVEQHWLIGFEKA
jgi:hypothetical protein